VTVTETEDPALTVTFAGSGDAFGSGGRYQACVHLRGSDGGDPVLLDCGATSLSALKRLGLDPGEIAAVFVSHLHGDHFGGLPFLILDGQFSRRTKPLTVAGPPGLARRLTDAMECMFPGSSTASRRFGIDTVELNPGSTSTVSGVTVSAWEGDHPSVLPASSRRRRRAGAPLG
jgi:ribonuclease BN (tRNA processing enzyme)